MMEAYKIANGYKDSDDEINSVDDLDQMYEGLADKMNADPESWH